MGLSWTGGRIVLGFRLKGIHQVRRGRRGIQGKELVFVREEVGNSASF